MKQPIIIIKIITVNCSRGAISNTVQPEEIVTLGNKRIKELKDVHLNCTPFEKNVKLLKKFFVNLRQFQLCLSSNNTKNMDTLKR